MVRGSAFGVSDRILVRLRSFFRHRLKNGYPYIQTPTVFANVASVIGNSSGLHRTGPPFVFTCSSVAFLPEGLPTLVMLCLVKEAHTPSKHKVRYK